HELFVAVAIWSLAGTASVGLSIVLARRRWFAFRTKFHGQSGPPEASRKPGLMATGLGPASWLETLRATLGRASKALGETEHEAARERAAALPAVAADPALASVSRDLAVQALETGGLQSALVKLGRSLVYLVLFPDRHEHAELFRRHDQFAAGWVDH